MSYELKRKLSSSLISLLLMAGQLVPFLNVFTPNLAYAANPGSDLDQCRNGTAGSPQDCIDIVGPLGWENGNAGSSNSHYLEGESIPYRMRFKNLSAGTHSVTIGWDTTKGGKHAIDYLTSFDETEATADPCSGVAGCGSPDTETITDDPNSSVTQLPGSFTLYNGTITSLSTYTLYSGSYAADSSTEITINFTTSVADPVLAWGGHIGSQVDWGIGNSAVGISGSPYHMRLIDLDGAGGNQDHSLSAAAIIPPGYLTIAKDVVPDDASLWDFGVTGPESYSGGTTLGDGDSTIFIVNPGIYTTSETTSPSYSTSVSCDTGESGTSSVVTDVASEESILCTFVNTVHNGSITVEKVTNPSETEQTFDFDLGGDASGSTTLGSGGSDTFSDLLPGNYSLTEGGVVGWDQTGVVCSDESDPSSISLSAGEDVTCTFTNERLPLLTVVKDVVNDNGGTAIVEDFDLYVNSEENLVNSGDTNVFDPGDYLVGELGLDGYLLDSISGGCDGDGNISLGYGDDVTCYLTNDDIAPSLTLNKVVVNDDGGTAEPTDWNLTATGPTSINGAGGVSSDATFEAGDYVLSESTGPSGYTASGWTCSNGDNDGTISIGLGEDVTCEITNDDQPGHLIVHKITDPSSNDTTQFSITATGGTVQGNAIQDIAGGGSVDYTVNAGTYDVSEADLAGWDETGNTCNDIVVANGETEECTITNTQRGHIIVVKNAIPNGVQDFTFHNNFGNGNPTSFLLDDDSNATLLDTRSFEVLPGEYSVSEDAVAGWDQESALCDSGETIGSINVAPNETVTCTFTNEELAQIVLVKNTVGGDGSFDFDATGAGLPFNIDLDTIGGTASQTFSDLDPDNTYTIAETSQLGWELIGSECTGTNNSPDSITPNAGEVITCTFTNGRLPTLTVTKDLITDNGGDETVDDFGLFIDDDPSDWGTSYILGIGDHSFFEIGPDGYASSFSEGCANGEVSLEYGDEKVCTITNNDIAPTVTLIKNVTNEDGGNAGENDFGLSVGGNSVNSGETVEVDANTPIALDEAGLEGYEFVSLTGDQGCPSELGGTVTLNEGENVTCTITNDDQPGTLIVKKVVIADNGGSLEADDFSFSVNEGEPVSFEADGQNDLTVPAGEYDVAEPAVAGWDTSYENCTNVAVPNGGSATCTITNDDQPGTLIVKKIVINDNGGNAVGSDFYFQVNGGEPGPFLNEEELKEITVDQGTYTVTEETAAGYETGYENCSEIFVPNGGSATCIVTNDDIAPTITLYKEVINNNGGNAGPIDFGLTVGGNSVTSGDITEVAANTPIALNEAGLFGYQFVSITGDEGCPQALEGTVTLNEGESLSCTITNDDIAPQLTVIKHVINNSTGTLIAEDFTILVAATNPSPSEFSGDENGTLVTLDAGVYVVVEEPTAGYTVSYSEDCDGIIGVGEEKTCTVTNNDQDVLGEETEGEVLPATGMALINLLGAALALQAGLWLRRRSKNLS